EVARDRVNPTKRVKIGGGAIDRRNQRIGERDRATGDRRILSGQIDENIIPIMPEAFDLLHEQRAALGLEHGMVGARERYHQRAGGSVPRFQKTMEALLTTVAVDDENLHRSVRERYRAKERESRLAYPPFLVGESDDVSRRSASRLQIVQVNRGVLVSQAHFARVERAVWLPLLRHSGSPGGKRIASPASSLWITTG